MHLKTVSAAVALALISTTALAADLPSRRAPPVFTPPPPLPVFSWTGLYVGGHVGYAFGKSNTLIVNNNNGIGVAAGSGNPNGVIGGAHVGYLFAVPSIPLFGGAGSSLVAGIEGDVDGSNYHSSYAVPAFTATTREDIQGSVRGRLGVAVDRVLFYATGGAAFAGLKNSYFNPNGSQDSFNQARVGWTAGGGIEYAITNNWSARVEYRYTDFGTVNNVLTNTTGGAANARTKLSDSRVQAGISYKFDMFGPTAPVVARY